MKNGWVKSYRRTLDNPIVCRDAEHLAVWMYLLLEATHADKDDYFRGQRITLKPGQLITGRNKIANHFNMHPSKVQRVLRKFEIEQQIKQQTSNVSRLITILNWEDYQGDEQPCEQQLNNNRTTTEQQLNTIQECKNVRSNNIYTSEVQKASYKKALLSELNSDEYDLNNEYVEIAKAFQKLFISNLSEAGASTRQVEKAAGVWVDPIRLAIEKDGYSVADFREVFEFLRRDAFWKSNILSTQKLRQQMAKLKIQIKNENIRNSNRTGKQNQRQSFSDEELAEQIRQGAARAIADASSEAGY